LALQLRVCDHESLMLQASHGYSIFSEAKLHYEMKQLWLCEVIVLPTDLKQRLKRWKPRHWETSRNHRRFCEAVQQGVVLSLDNCGYC
jgi:dephospho-CoA kinase